MKNGPSQTQKSSSKKVCYQSMRPILLPSTYALSLVNTLNTQIRSCATNPWYIPDHLASLKEKITSGQMKSISVVDN